MTTHDLKCAERRSDMVLYLSRIRETHYRDLMDRYKISAPTLNKDLLYLESVYKVPITRTRGAYGSIKVMEGWKANQNYLNEEQIKVIEKAMTVLSDDEGKVLQTILNDFAPKTMKNTEKDL